MSKFVLEYKKYYFEEKNPTAVAIKGVFLGLFYILTIALLLIMTLGTRIYVVVGWSMQPTIDYMSIVFVVGDKDDVYEVGDILTFSMGSAVNTHRVLQVVYNTPGQPSSGIEYYLTKGDNPELDTEEHISPSNVLGKVFTMGDNFIGTIPGIGSMILFLQNNLYILIACAIGAYIFFVSIPRKNDYECYHP